MPRRAAAGEALGTDAGGRPGRHRGSVVRSGGTPPRKGRGVIGGRFIARMSRQHVPEIGPPECWDYADEELANLKEALDKAESEGIRDDGKAAGRAWEDSLRATC